jgi:tRNA(Ile)-lysidine synthase TilS/MesJ
MKKVFVIFVIILFIVKPKGLDFLEKEINIKAKRNKRVLLGLSGGRDSSYALHFLVNELNIKPITYNYDWGLNTEIARKNVAIMTGNLGVENIMIAC